MAGTQELGFETASWGRRILALVVDWIASTLVAIVLVGGADSYFEPGSPAGLVTTGVYVVQAGVLTWLIGGSFGKIATRLRVVPANGALRPISPLRLLGRQLMIALVIPPLVFKPDGRGLHDIVAGTATVSLDTYSALVARRG